MEGDSHPPQVLLQERIPTPLHECGGVAHILVGAEGVVGEGREDPPAHAEESRGTQGVYATGWHCTDDSRQMPTGMGRPAADCGDHTQILPRCTDDSAPLLGANTFPPPPHEDDSGGETDVLRILIDETPRRVSRVWGSWGEYTLDPKWRQWALQQLGVGEVPILVDLFSEPWSAAADLFITKAMDSFSFNWGALQEGSAGLLWANPPFRMLARVADKIAQEPCWVALCTPEWETED